MRHLGLCFSYTVPILYCFAQAVGSPLFLVHVRACVCVEYILPLTYTLQKTR